MDEARRVVARAEEVGIILRVMGATAVRLHCEKFADLYRALGRELSDLDFVGYSRDAKKVKELFERLNYTQRRLGYAIAVSAHGERYIFDDEKNNRVVDVFFDRLKMCHTVEFKDRLELDKPTITLADILLEKMQIVKLNEKDIKDTVVLLREHEIGDTEKETVNMRCIVGLLRDDWGFYHTVTTNLKTIEESLEKFDVLTKEDCDDVASKVRRLLDAIESETKSLKWKMRARVGTSKKWYEEVEETVR